MIEKTNSLLYVDMESNNVYSNGKKIIAINLKLFYISFLENCSNWVQDETSKFLCLEFFSKCPTNFTFDIFHLTYHNGMIQSFLCS